MSFRQKLSAKPIKTHKNRIIHDNRKANLHIISQSEQNENQSQLSTKPIKTHKTSTFGTNFFVCFDRFG